MRVKAIKKCFFGVARRSKGAEFDVDEGTVLPDFLELVKPEKKPAKKPAKKQAKTHPTTSETVPTK